MNSKDQKIAEVLARFDEEFSTSVWRVQGTAVIYHKTLERIAAHAKIKFDPPTIVRAERDEAVVLVVGGLGERVEWSIGEALIGVNYRVSGKQAAYVYAMAEKRAKDRVILKLIELSGDVYSEEEADEFKQGRPTRGDEQGDAQKQDQPEQEIIEPDEVSKWKRKISEAMTINAVTDLMLHPDTQKALADMAEGFRDSIRDYARGRLVGLGWPAKKAG